MAISKFPAVLLAGGEPPPREWALPRLQRAPWVLCADSGLRIALECGVLPQALVGDLDSLSAQELESLPPLQLGLHRHPAEKDQSDLHLALQLLSHHYQGAVEILGALGGRWDHSLFNLCSVLFLAWDWGLQASIVDPQTVVFPLSSRRAASLVLQDYQGYHCSLLPLSEELEEVRLEGFRYPLQGELLSRYATRGLSNTVVENRAEIQLGEGQGLVILSRP